MQVGQSVYPLPNRPTGHPAMPGGLFCVNGNPLSDGTWTYEWVNGRQLARIYSIDTDASFVYNENGMRVQKTVNGVVTKYILHGKNIAHMTSGSDELHFLYDAQNKPAIVDFNGIKYAYVHNLQGDIVAIRNSNGTIVVQYKYDAWGKPISKTGSMASTLGTVQPFRYRGYVYDVETGLYYLRSRYYNPEWGRFVNADRLVEGNIFEYCQNNPVKKIDPNGFSTQNFDFYEDDDGEVYLTKAYYEYIKQQETLITSRVADIGKQILEYSPPINSVYVNVSTLFERLNYFNSRRLNFRSPGDSGCGMYIRAGILNKTESHGSHIYLAGASSMFKNDMILSGKISDIGGVTNLIPGMILGSTKDGSTTAWPYQVEHVGVFVGYTSENESIPMVHSFNTDKNYGNLLPFYDNNWVYYGWHKGIVMD